MTQPTAYNRATDFSERDGSETDHPALNQELDQAALSINQIRDSLVKIQRDDGALANGVVTADSMTESAYAAIASVVNVAKGQAQAAAESSTLAASTAVAARDQILATDLVAQASANAAALNATLAVTKAGEASASATSAATSASTATTKASEASASAATATTQASNAVASSSAATTAKNAAEAAATAASSSASTSATQASAATTQAGAAAGSAGAASTSATAAASSASQAAASALSNDPATLVRKTSQTGAAKSPAGGTADRPSAPEFGWDRANSDLTQKEWWNGFAWVPMGGGAVGGGTDALGVENDTFIGTPYTIGSAAILPCAISIASPCVVTQTNAYLKDQPVRFTTTGALPTGLSVNERYFIIAAGLTTSSFQVSLTQGGTAVNTSGTQSGAQGVGKTKNMNVAGGITIGDAGGITIPTGCGLVIGG